MQKCGFTFRADSGTPNFDHSSQPAVLTTLKYNLGASAGAPKGKRPINHHKSRASRAPALQPKDNKSFAATNATLKFGFSAANPLIVDFPAPEKNNNSKIGLSRFQENVDIPPTPPPNKSREQTTLVAVTKDPMDNSSQPYVFSRRDINENDKASFSAFRNDRAESVCAEGFPVLGYAFGLSNDVWT